MSSLFSIMMEQGGILVNRKSYGPFQFLSAVGEVDSPYQLHGDNGTFLALNRTMAPLKGKSVEVSGGIMVRQLPLDVSPLCGEIVSLKWDREHSNPDLLPQIEIPSDSMNEEQLWWATYVPEDGIDHWYDASAKGSGGGASGRNCTEAYPLYWIKFALENSGNRDILDGIATYLQRYVLEQYMKRADLHRVDGHGESLPAGPVSRHGYTPSYVQRPLIDMLYAHWVATGSRLAFPLMKDIADRTAKTLKSGQPLTGLFLGHAARVFHLMNQVHGDFARFDYSEELQLALGATSSYNDFESNCHRAYAYYLTGGEDPEMVRDIIITFPKGENDLPWIALNPLVMAAEKGNVDADNLAKRFWFDIPRRAHALGKSWWGERGNRYVWRFAARAASRYGWEGWPQYDGRFPYEKTWPR